MPNPIIEWADSLEPDYDYDVTYEMLARGITDPEPSERRKKVIWAAGFFDGEGNLMIRARQGKADKRPYYSLRICCTQVYREPLEIFHKMWGGFFGYQDKKLSNERAFYRWECWSDKASLALQEMQPYLVVKAAETRHALDFQSRRRRSTEAWDEWAMLELRRLKGRGDRSCRTLAA